MHTYDISYTITKQYRLGQSIIIKWSCDFNCKVMWHQYQNTYIYFIDMYWKYMIGHWENVIWARVHKKIEAISDP